MLGGSKPDNKHCTLLSRLSQIPLVHKTHRTRSKASHRHRMSAPSSKYGGKTLIPHTITVISGVFSQSSPNEWSSLNKGQQSRCLKRLGLIDDSSRAWSKLESNIVVQNHAAGDERAILLFLFRHGEAIHNIAQQHYTKEQWSALKRVNGDGPWIWGSC